MKKMKKIATINTPAINLLSMQGTALLKVLISITITGLLIVADMERRRIKRMAQSRRLTSIALENLESSLHNWLAKPGTIAYSFGENSASNGPLTTTRPAGADANTWEYDETTAYRGMNKEAYRGDTMLGFQTNAHPMMPQQISIWATREIPGSLIWINKAPTVPPTNPNHIYSYLGLAKDPTESEKYRKYFATHIVIPDLNADGTFKSAPGSGTLKLMPGNGLLKNLIGYPNRDGTNIQSVDDGELTYIAAMWVEAAKVYAPPTFSRTKPVADEWASYQGAYMEGMVHFKVLIWTFVNRFEYQNALAAGNPPPPPLGCPAPYTKCIPGCSPYPFTPRYHITILL